MKVIAETTGPFQLIGLDGELLHFDRPTVVSDGHYLEIFVARKQAKILGQVNDDATDEAFVEVLKGTDGDVEFAVSAFVTEFPHEVADPKKIEKTDPKAPKSEPK